MALGAAWSEIPGRMRAYLIEWRADSEEKYLSMHPDTELTLLSEKHLFILFCYATSRDANLMHEQMIINQKKKA